MYHKWNLPMVLLLNNFQNYVLDSYIHGLEQFSPIELAF